MAFVSNERQQIGLEDSTYGLTCRSQRILKKSWAEHFSQKIFPLINEERFAVLYSDNLASRPNTPVNVIIGLLILKELYSHTDDNLLETLLFDVRYQYVVLDPFCGCGTSIAAAQRLGRHWIGIDITHLAITLMKHRLKDAFGDQAVYRVIGEPVSLPDAETLAASDPYQFQWWALGLVGARPAEGKKGADQGIDGRLYFHDESDGNKTKQVIFSVKAGHLTAGHVRDLHGVIDREQAAIGVLLSFQEPTQPMRTEAASAGFYDSPGWNKRYPRLQILTIADLLSGKGIDMPPLYQVSVTFKKAPKAKSSDEPMAQLSLDMTDNM